MTIEGYLLTVLIVIVIAAGLGWVSIATQAHIDEKHHRPAPTTHRRKWDRKRTI